MKWLRWIALLAVPALALSQAQGPWGIFGGPIPSAQLAPAAQVPANTYAFTTDQGLMVDNGSAWVTVGGGGGSGTVTTVSVVTANGLKGTVANATTAPAITLAPNFTGIAYSSGTALAAAVAANFPTLNQNTTGTASNLSGTPALPNGTTATTQSMGDNTAKLATDAFVLANAGSAPAFSAVTSGSNTTTLTVGSGGTLGPTGTGKITSNALLGYATASLPTCNGGAAGQVAYTTDGTASFVFCNGASWVGGGGTKFTYSATGCTPSASSGTATAGSITLASGPCTSIVITMNGAIGMTAPNGWHCTVGDPTALAAGTWIPGWYEDASTTTTATIPIPGAAGATDVMTFACTER